MPEPPIRFPCVAGGPQGAGDRIDRRTPHPFRRTSYPFRTPLGRRAARIGGRRKTIGAGQDKGRAILLLFIVRRILSAIPTLLVLSILAFLVIQAPPGDYADVIKNNAISRAGASVADAERAAELYREQHGLNDPLLVQYWSWITGIVTRGDFGHSFYYNKPVSDVVWSRLPATLALALVSHLLATLIGVSMGILAATRQHSWLDTVFSFIAFLGMTIPRFLLAIVILYILVFKLDVREVSSFYSPRYSGAEWSLAKLWNLITHVWPVIAIAAFGGLAYNMRVMRSNLLDVLNAQYVETARAKGLPERTVIMRHAVPNALHPLVMFQGIALPYMLTGEIEVAIVFALATVGPAIVGSMQVGDVYVTATFMLLLACTLIIGNIIADILLAAIDPRVRIGANA